MYSYPKVVGLPRIRETLGSCPREDFGGDSPDRVLHQVVGGTGCDGGEDPGRNHRPPHHDGAPPAGEALYGHEDTYV